MRALRGLPPDALGELGNRDRSRVTVAMLPYGDRRALGLPVADHQHVGHLAQLGVADLAPDGLGAIVDLGAYAGLAQLIAHARGDLVVAVAGPLHQGLSPAPPPPDVAPRLVPRDGARTISCNPH